jgi:hypothetical protein
VKLLDAAWELSGGNLTAAEVATEGTKEEPPGNPESHRGVGWSGKGDLKRH